METRICKTCKEELTIDWFHLSRKTPKGNQYRHSCIKCDKGYKMPKILKDQKKLDLFLRGVKICRVCKQELSFDYFYEGMARCKKCYGNFLKSDKHKLQVKISRYKKTYGLSLDELELKKKSQNYKCAICEIEFGSAKGKACNIDHCHKTGKVRDMLCSSCNTALGLMNEDIELLKSMIQYINKWNK